MRHRHYKGERIVRKKGLWRKGKDSVVGIVRGAGDVPEATVQETRRITIVALQGTADVAKTATGLASDTTSGAMEAAQERGESAVKGVTGVTSEAVKGAKVVLPFKND